MINVGERYTHSAGSLSWWNWLRIGLNVDYFNFKTSSCSPTTADNEHLTSVCTWKYICTIFSRAESMYHSPSMRWQNWVRQKCITGTLLKFSRRHNVDADETVPTTITSWNIDITGVFLASAHYWRTPATALQKSTLSTIDGRTDSWREEKVQLDVFHGSTPTGGEDDRNWLEVSGNGARERLRIHESRTKARACDISSATYIYCVYAGTGGARSLEQPVVYSVHRWSTCTHRALVVVVLFFKVLYGSASQQYNVVWDPRAIKPARAGFPRGGRGKGTWTDAWSTPFDWLFSAREIFRVCSEPSDILLPSLLSRFPSSACYLAFLLITRC
jgi:hypothetical protein